MHCGRYGHERGLCPERILDAAVPKDSVTNQNREIGHNSSNPGVLKTTSTEPAVSGVGEWMIAARKPRRTPRPRGNIEQSIPPNSDNRFAALDNDFNEDSSNHGVFTSGANVEAMVQDRPTIPVANKGKRPLSKTRTSGKQKTGGRRGNLRCETWCNR